MSREITIVMFSADQSLQMTDAVYSLWNKTGVSTRKQKVYPGFSKYNI